MKILWQLFLILLFSFLGEVISLYVLPFPFPGSIIGLILLFLFLCLRVVKVTHMKEVSQWLQKNMAFFFVPLCVGIMDFFDVIRLQWHIILIVIIFSTILTMMATAFVAQKGAKHE